MASAPTVLNTFLSIDLAGRTRPGWSEEQLLEAFADTFRTVFTDYSNHLVNTEQDVPTAPEL